MTIKHISAFIVALIAISGMAQYQNQPYIAKGNNTKQDFKFIDLSKSNVENLSDIASKIHTRELSLNDRSITIGAPLSVAFSPSAVYILDWNGAVSKFSLSGNESAKQINCKGYSLQQDCVPTCIDCFRDTVYVYNLANSEIMRFDSDLNPITSIQLAHPSFSFTVSDVGIIAENSDFETIPNRFILSDTNGNLRKSLIDSKPDEEVSFDRTGCSPLKKIDGKVYLLDEKDYKIYTIEKDNISPLYQYDFGNDNRPLNIIKNSCELYPKYATVTDCFKLGNTMLLSYILKKRLYCFYDKATDKFRNGTITDTSDGFPFYPRWQHGKELVGYLAADEGNGSLLFYSVDL